MDSFAVCVVSDVGFRVHLGGLSAGLQSFGEERARCEMRCEMKCEKRDEELES